ncbi:glycosyltransferase family 4 protein [Aetokthonos hydrillicola Thurmond2011]|jgi:glycosyltransferase involved in cell wall biosynthesis|uniref:Glycosyltransferase family 4 protein n=1 Tax=Aetokthonos hydrillicola Thurmond2011 TaxID=2712845 RepID=A0AAP5M4F9_9CYAN|nr:glycosyltransferase family 4 protein [Aetokthonos hydrillicola]MBO3463541.1 glycosyltransferase family 4 protein [Aetokthonos hydrillicola CCALA 1050]MBW4590261.1 glycosyltransferase family 4 protein [Aetokthonos hydrillicola CCALA 1050]MDR9894831.1 glycosyltransferase family 4 protein [Aetokthonos hydrillicola Thurmond2011]
MHIIVLENEVTSSRGGQERSLLDVCQGLYNRGHNISLFYIKEGDLLNNYRAFCSNLSKVNTYRIERHNFFDSFKNFVSCNLKTKVTKNTIVYSNQYHDSFFGYTLALFKNIPFVCHLRLPPPPIEKFGLQWRIGMHGAKRLIAVSQQTKLDWVNRGYQANKIDVVYNGINPELFQRSASQLIAKTQWGISENTKVVSYIGRLDKEKGIETLINGFALFFKRYEHAKLLIAGKPLCENDDYKKSLHQLTQDLGIEKNVNFLGHITNTTDLYHISDCTVLPSIHSEPFGRTVIESMACGTPVIASRTGGICEILTGEFQEWLFEPGNPQELADTLNYVVKSKDLNHQLSAKCREHILHNFHVDRMVEGVEKVLLHVLNN